VGLACFTLLVLSSVAIVAATPVPVVSTALPTPTAQFSKISGINIQPDLVLSSDDPITFYTYLPLVAVGPQAPSPGDCLTAEEADLARLINEYRNANGLADVPVSRSLTQVAQWHVIDLHENNPDSGTDSRGLPCNMHSWSDQGIWSPVCYTSDHAYASGMWDKPREITGDVYTGNGYEIAYGSSGQATASGALNAWKSSSGHRDVILENGMWSGSNWPAMGVGIYQHHAVVWFGRQPDPQGTVTQCP
jgi:uncharacterized protein YkwD